MRLSLFFVNVRQEKPSLAFPIFFALVVGVGAASPALARPVQLAPVCDELLSIMFV